jgi:hypothetical protein
MNPYDDIPAAKGTFIDTSPVTDDTKTEPAAAEDIKTISGARKKMRLEATEESLTETELVIHKIEPHLHSDKKFQRAMELLRQFLTTSDFSDTSAAQSIFDLLTRLMNNPRNITEEIFRTHYKSLFTVVWEMREVFGSSRLPILKAWNLKACVNFHILTTDDSFEFARNLRILCDCVKELPMDGIAEECKALYIDAIFDCLQQALRRYSVRLWAKQPVEAVFSSTIDKRFLLSENERERLDMLTNQLEAEKRKCASFVGQQSVRTLNSAAHPLQKRSGILR